MKKSIIAFVVVTATVMPTLQEISVCFHTKSHLFQRYMKRCTPDNQACMVEQFTKVCEFK